MIVTTDDSRILRKRLAQKYPLVTRSVEVGGRLWRVTAVQDQDALLDAVETEQDLHHFPFGMLLWASAIGLARHLAESPHFVRGQRVLELGAGAGLPGMVAASLGADVTQTDYQRDTLALARVNALENEITSVQQAVGDWRNWSVKGQFDIVIGSDVLYERSLHHDLKRLLERFSRAGAEIILADPVRPQAMELIAELEKQGWDVGMETREVSWEGEAKEIVLFSLAIGC